MGNFAHSARKNLVEYSNINQIIQRIFESEKITFVVGAGISVSCGIPDFRSPGGFYDTLSKQGFANPTDVFDLNIIRTKPEVFYSNSVSLLPSNFQPGPTHRFFAALARRNKILRIYTQNIDTLENKAGVPRDRIIYCHGSMERCTCLRCGKEKDIAEIEPFILKKEVPYCTDCQEKDKEGGKEEEGKYPLPIFKPNVVFFGESLPTEYFQKKETDFAETDLLIVTGTSLQVQPVSELIYDPPSTVPQVLVNRESAGPPNHFDAYLFGNSDDVFSYIAEKLGYDISPGAQEREQEQGSSIALLKPRLGLFSKAVAVSALSSSSSSATSALSASSSGASGDGVGVDVPADAIANNSGTNGVSSSGGDEKEGGAGAGTGTGGLEGEKKDEGEAETGPGAETEGDTFSLPELVEGETVIDGAYVLVLEEPNITRVSLKKASDTESSLDSSAASASSSTSDK